MIRFLRFVYSFYSEGNFIVSYFILNFIILKRYTLRIINTKILIDVYYVD